jgi:hypothetical protein
LVERSNKNRRYLSKNNLQTKTKTKPFVAHRRESYLTVLSATGVIDIRLRPQALPAKPALFSNLPLRYIYRRA